MSSERAPLVSVVTPVYNGEDFLRECIESVLAQTYPHWDYTIVNNCSTDRTLDIAREYAARDSRIRVHSNETFVRAIENHNIAFRQISAESRYCKLVAADDWLFPECLAEMVQLAEAHPSVTIVGAYSLVDTEVGLDGLPYPSTVVPGRDACRWTLLGRPPIFGPPTTALFRSELLRSRYAFYNESNLQADKEAYLEFLEHSDFGFIHQVLTFTRVREDSLTSFSQSFATSYAGILYNLVKYGPKYLSGEELKERIREHLRIYYGYLGWQLFKRRGPKFWSFHRVKMAALGYRLSMLRVAAAAMSYALYIALNPHDTAYRLVRRVRSSLSRPSSNSSGDERAQYDHTHIEER